MTGDADARSTGVIAIAPHEPFVGTPAIETVTGYRLNVSAGIVTLAAN